MNYLMKKPQYFHRIPLEELNLSFQVLKPDLECPNKQPIACP